ETCLDHDPGGFGPPKEPRAGTLLLLGLAHQELNPLLRAPRPDLLHGAVQRGATEPGARLRARRPARRGARFLGRLRGGAEEPAALQPRPRLRVRRWRVVHEREV